MPRLNETLYKFPSISQELIDTLDWAWLVDFGQGNFDLAKAKTEIALLSEWNTSHLLARALVHQLQGEYDRAVSLLEQALTIESDPQNKLIIATVSYLTERKITENLIDGCSLSTTKTDTDTRWKNRIKPFKQEVADLNYRLEINFIQQVASILPCWRTTIIQQTDRELKKQYEELILEQTTEQLELYQEKEYHAISEFLYGCFADLLSLSGQFVASWELLETLAPVYLNSEKYLETAWYLMCQGDLIVETNSFGKPIAFGYRLLAEDFDFSKFQFLDRSLIDSATAQQKYIEARQYFSLAEEIRGEAMAIMRLAYVNGLQQQWYLATCGYEEARKAFLEVGDFLNAIAAEMGGLWSCLHDRDLNGELLTELEKSAAWMLKNKTVAFGMSWLLSFTAAAQEVLFQEEGIAVARRYIKIAELIATKAIDLPTVNSSVSCSQLWKKCHFVIGEFYRNLAIALARENDWQKAFAISERAKFFNLYSQGDLNLQQNSLETKLNSIVSFEKIVASIPNDTVLLSFLIASDSLLGWAVTSKGLVKTNLLEEIESEEFKSENLEQTINIWLNDLLDSNFNIELNLVLENIFLKPFAAEIETKKHLLFVGCDRLQGFSFSALKYHYLPQSNILKKEIILGSEKLISYLFYASQIVNCKLTATATDRMLIITENEDSLHTQKTEQSIGDFRELSLAQGLSFAIAQIYSISPFNNLNEITPEIVDLIESKPVIHLFSSKNSSLIKNIVEQNISHELVILNVLNFKLRQLPAKQINNLIRDLLCSGTKTILVIFESEDNLATAILTSFFHQGLYFGQSIVESLRQAQKQLRLVTAKEALDFCHYLQSHIAWQTRKDRALRALITKYTGDIMVLGKDYNRATEAYSVAIRIFEDIDCKTEAESLKNNYKMFKSLQRISKPFQEQKLIFDAPAYWNSAFIYGNWQLSFTDL